MSARFIELLDRQVEEMKTAGTYKRERILTSAQQPHIQVSTGKTVLNFCANNYLGLANHPEVLSAAAKGLREFGYGLASVRFIVEHRAFTKASRRKSASSSVKRTPFFTIRAGMPTEGCLRPFWGRRMPSFPMS